MPDTSKPSRAGLKDPSQLFAVEARHASVGDQGKTGAGSVLTGGRCPDRAVADNVPSLCRRGALPASCDAA